MFDNRSFFEKLTGSMKVEEERLPISEEKKSEEFEVRAASVSAPKTKKSTPVEIPITAEKTPEAKEKQWPEEEASGQLTIDVFQTKDYIVVQSTVAGVDPENLDVSYTDDMITITGRRERMEEAKEEDYYYKELYWGAFSRSVILPEPVDAEKAEATLKNGVLTIRLPKKSPIRSQKIKVKTV